MLSNDGRRVKQGRVFECVRNRLRLVCCLCARETETVGGWAGVVVVVVVGGDGCIGVGEIMRGG